MVNQTRMILTYNVEQSSFEFGSNVHRINTATSSCENLISKCSESVTCTQSSMNCTHVH